jgi:hypothetical protein
MLSFGRCPLGGGALGRTLDNWLFLLVVVSTEVNGAPELRFLCQNKENVRKFMYMYPYNVPICNTPK